MFEASGFAVGKCLTSNARHRIYAAVRKSDGLAVVLKTAAPSAAVPTEEALSREYEALRALEGPGILDALEFLPGPQPALVLSRVPGVTLGGWVSATHPPIDAVLDVAIQLSAALETVHGRRWIHSDLSPSNVMVDPATSQAHLIDFGLARPLGSLAQSMDVTYQARDLAYVSPEQTGRMNRGVDARSDLYSLGGLLYYALSGSPPFPLDDPLALIHAHMARIPPPPHEVRPEVPPVLSRVVLTLLEKEPENRYPDARALGADLRRCREELLERGELRDDLVLLGTASTDQLRLPARLYGRDTEVARLCSLYEHAAAGSVAVGMIAGDPGSGKSALVDELRPHLAERGGYLAKGKFTPSSERPYAVWSSVLGDLVHQMLVEPDARLEEWSRHLREALGNIAQVLVELVPDLEFVLGEVSPVPTLGAKETQARLALALRRFVRACATPEHPLLLCLDDLQWCDAPSRLVLEQIVRHEHSAALLVIGTYRRADVHSGHSLERWLGQLEAAEIRVESIDLDALSPESVAHWLADVLAQPVDAIQSLAALVEVKTGNIPLLVRQFLEHVHAEGFLRHEPDRGWTWDADAVAASEIPDGAVALMTAKLHRLERDAHAAVQLAACAGDAFDLDALCELGALDRETLQQGLYSLWDSGLIVACPSGFRFVHDGVREAAQELVGAEERARQHYDIAVRLLERIPESERGDRIFEIAEHLDRGLVHLPAERRLEGIRINLGAAARALAAGAVDSAERFLAVGRSLLRDEDPAEQPALYFDLLITSIDGAYLTGAFEQALEWAAALERQPLSIVQSAQVETRRLQIFALSRAGEDCVRYALRVLRRFGVRWPLRPSRLRARLALRRMRWRLRGARVEASLRPAEDLDPRTVAVILVLGAAGAAIARWSVNLVSLAACWTTGSNLRAGYVVRPEFSLAAVSVYLQMIEGDSSEAKRLEDVALAAGKRLRDPVYGPKCEFNLRALQNPWRMPRRRAIEPLDRIAGELREVGEIEYAYYARFMKAFFGGLAGERVGVTARTLSELVEDIRCSGHLYPDAEDCLRPFRYLLLGDHATLDTELAESEVQMTSNTRGSIDTYGRTAWLMALCIYGRFDLAFAQSEALGERLFEAAPYVHVADHCLYRGLAAAALAAGVRGTARRRYRRALRKCLRKLRHWALSGPDFPHMALLLGAEQARLSGQPTRALVAHRTAARQAEEQGHLQHAALAHERSAVIFLDQRRRPEALAALARARELYAAWGSPPKAAQLAEQMRELDTRST